jgi:hypothetical protein
VTITRDQARALVEAFLADVVREGLPLAVADDRNEVDVGWVFVWDSAEFFATGAVSARVVGNVPLLVDHLGGIHALDPEQDMADDISDIRAELVATAALPAGAIEVDVATDDYHLVVSAIRDAYETTDDPYTTDLTEHAELIAALRVRMAHPSFVALVEHGVLRHPDEPGRFVPIATDADREILRRVAGLDEVGGSEVRR